jgi:3D (Asp-Asp-Asp) domain-containing protein
MLRVYRRLAVNHAMVGTMRATGLALLLVTTACGGAGAGEAPDAEIEPDARARPEPGPSLGEFRLTYYWVTDEDEFTGDADTPIYDDDDGVCDVLGTVPAEFADSLDLEGTGRLADGRVINVDGACACPRSPCFVEVDAEHPWGYGVQNRALEPYRTFAVDRDVIEYGTTLYVPDLDGVMVPGDAPWGDFVHDGCVLAGDTGGGIVDMHVDWFVALRASYLDLDGRLDLDMVTVHDGGARCPPPP